MSNSEQTRIELTLDHVSPATLLLEKHRQMLEVQQALDTEKEEYTRKQAMFKRREQQLRKKDLELQENLCQFNKFLRDKADKRQQYLKKCDDERRVCSQKDRDIITKQKELTDILRMCQTLEREFTSHEKYEKYLELVKQKSYQDFPEIENILKRYYLLNDARANLEKSEEQNARDVERLRIGLQQYTKTQNNKYLDLNNEKQRLQRRLEQAVNESNELEAQLSKIVSANTDRNRSLGQLVMSSRNNYQQCKQYLKGIHHFHDLREAPETAGVAVDSNSQQQSVMDEIEDRNFDRKLMNFEITQKLDIIAHYIQDCQQIAGACDEFD